ncbi:MAG: hypothetical protein RMJ55_19655, partial [Roseiflexaceae bacterium]|nr:hypothetical protein [Roseiflexaceae bacterium]
MGLPRLEQGLMIFEKIIRHSPVQLAQADFATIARDLLVRKRSFLTFCDLERGESHTASGRG